MRTDLGREVDRLERDPDGLSARRLVRRGEPSFAEARVDVQPGADRVDAMALEAARTSSRLSGESSPG